MKFLPWFLFRHFAQNVKKRESCSLFYLQSIPLGVTLPSAPGAEASSTSTPWCNRRAEAQAPLYFLERGTSLPFFCGKICHPCLSPSLWTGTLHGWFYIYFIFGWGGGAGSPACSHMKSHEPGHLGKGSAPSICAQALLYTTHSSSRCCKICDPWWKPAAVISEECRNISGRRSEKKNSLKGRE